MAAQARGTVDRAEVEQFDRIAADWWDPNGPFKPLHRMNPTRIGYIRDRLCSHYGRDPLAPKPLQGLRILDVGCGGGLLAEPMARLGATVTGIDASPDGIAVAERHAEEGGLSIDYRVQAAEALAAEGARFDAVLALEIVEHVADTDTFLSALASLMAPGGGLAISTLNRTPKSFALAIVGAEYLLRWIPRGTHDWRRFLRPSELAGGLRAQGVQVRDICGMVLDPVRGRWRLAAHDLDVNYILFATR